MNNQHVRRVVLLAALGLAAGCGGPHTPVRVEGVVTLDGNPVEGAAISFLSEAGDGKEGRMAYGTTDGEGVFRLTTLKPDDGALPGTYKVLVTKSVPVPPGVKVPNFPNTLEG